MRKPLRIFVRHLPVGCYVGDPNPPPDKIIAVWHHDAESTRNLPWKNYTIDGEFKLGHILRSDYNKWTYNKYITLSEAAHLFKYVTFESNIFSKLWKEFGKIIEC